MNFSRVPPKNSSSSFGIMRLSISSCYKTKSFHIMFKL